jgi:undecaprenyl-diphosphatase
MHIFLILFGAKYLFGVIIIVALWQWWRLAPLQQKEMMFLALIALPLSYIMAKIGSLVYFDPRPFVVEHFVPLIAHANDNGFPSDHTLISAAFASVVYWSAKRLGWVLLAASLLVGLSRVAAGVHYLTDVAGSLAIAFGVTALVKWLFVHYGKR